MFGDAGPDEVAGGVVHAAADDEAFGSGLFEHLAEKVGVEIGGGVFYGETRVSISVRLDFAHWADVCRFHSKSSFGRSVWRIIERRVPIGMSLRG